MLAVTPSENAREAVAEFHLVDDPHAACAEPTLIRRRITFADTTSPVPVTDDRVCYSCGLEEPVSHRTDPSLSVALGDPPEGAEVTAADMAAVCVESAEDWWERMANEVPAAPYVHDPALDA